MKSIETKKVPGRYTAAMDLESERYYRQILTPEQFRVMREGGTETPRTGAYWDFGERGIYVCAACSNIVFLSLNKIKSESGWPEFTRPANKAAVDFSGKDGKTFVSCKRCESHLGIIVPREGKKMYQINSIALDFKELPDIEWKDAHDRTTGDDNKQTVAHRQPQSKTLALSISALALGLTLGAGLVWALTPPVPAAAENPAISTTLLPTPLPTATSTTDPAPSPAPKRPRAASGSTLEQKPSPALATSSSPVPVQPATTSESATSSAPSI